MVFSPVKRLPTQWNKVYAIFTYAICLVTLKLPVFRSCNLYIERLFEMAQGTIIDYF